jgi:hypothetical protein
VGIDHGGFDIFMPQEFLHGADIVAVLQQVGSEAMAKGMAADPFANACLQDSLLERLLQATFV